MPYFTCDTSTIISRKLSDLPDNFLLSAVVVMELMAGASDASEFKRYQALSRDYSKDNFKAIQRYCNVKLVKGSTFFQ